VTRICPGNDRRSVVRWFSGSVVQFQRLAGNSHDRRKAMASGSVQWFSSRDLQEILMTVERRWPQALAWGLATREDDWWEAWVWASQSRR
jgi:hypothetical protein